MWSLVWGQHNKRVCWLVVPTSVDYEIPEDHTIEYWVCTSFQYGKYPQPMFVTIDREEAARYSKSLYMSQTAHNLRTVWRDSEGFIVNKRAVIKQTKVNHEN